MQNYVQYYIKFKHRLNLTRLCATRSASVMWENDNTDRTFVSELSTRLTYYVSIAMVIKYSFV